MQFSSTSVQRSSTLGLRQTITGKKLVNAFAVNGVSVRRVVVRTGTVGEGRWGECSVLRVVGSIV